MFKFSFFYCEGGGGGCSGQKRRSMVVIGYHLILLVGAKFLLLFADVGVMGLCMWLEAQSWTKLVETHCSVPKLSPNLTHLFQTTYKFIYDPPPPIQC